MTWKNNEPTPRKPKTWTWTEVWATIGVVLAVGFVAAGFYYGFQL